MLALKVEKIGDRVALVLNEDALAALGLRVGDTLRVEAGRDGTVRAVSPESWVDDPHARGRAFLRRYNRGFERLEG